MAEVSPFKGIYFDTSRVPIENVIAPPYDVISTDMQAELYDRSPYNFVRIMLNRATVQDSGTDNPYTRAARNLSDWLTSGILVRDSAPAYYEYIQRFAHPDHPSTIVSRTTLFVALGLEPYEQGIVLPHEETHPKAKADRLELMRATRSNPEPIYALYEDPDNTAANLMSESRGADPAFLEAQSPSPVGTIPDEHILFRHTDPKLIDALGAYMQPRRIWIADGHHRYETALNYRRERWESDGTPSKKKSYDLMLVGLSAFEDPGLVVLPTHRLVRNISSNRMESLLPQLQRYFQVRALSHEAALDWVRAPVGVEKRFSIVHPRGAYGLTLRDISQAQAGAAAGHCDAWTRLDVTVLQTLVLDRTLGISWQALAHTSDVAYTRDITEAISKVQSGEFQIACLLQNPTVGEVREVASAGEKMPQKSTFFYPKLWSGLLMRTLD